LSFEHEHKNPVGGCDSEFNWERVYKELAKPPNRWSRAEVDFNLRMLSDSTAYWISPHDRLSIMHYSFKPWMFVKGEDSDCYVPPPGGLSELDIAGARRAYPANAAADNLLRINSFSDALSWLPSDAINTRRVVARALVTEQGRADLGRP
jgi:hypothetical protein